MDNPEKVLTEYRAFSIPFILTSAVFFGLYLYVAAWIAAAWIPGFLIPDNRFYFFTGSGYSIDGTVLFAVMMIVSSAGCILLLRRMKARSMNWRVGLPLCIMTGIIALLMVIFTFLNLQTLCSGN